ncbi:MAG: ABC transporter permease subunit [Bacteroidales bacterium]|nr:ABC transporter permease subunit [Bacteroidales bacterium]
MKHFISKNRIILFLSVLFILIFWHLLSVLIPSGIGLPSPYITLKELIQTLCLKSTYISLVITILRGLLGFTIAFILAFLVGILSGLSPGFHVFLKPIILSIRSVPVISFLLLLLIWFKPGNVPVIIGILTMFPILSVNIIDGMKNVEKEYIQMCNVFCIPKARRIRDVYLPSILPFVFTGISNAMGFGWRAIIIGEVISQPEFGIGSTMQMAQLYLQIPKLIVWTILAIIISIIFEKVVRWIEKRIVFWR